MSQSKNPSATLPEPEQRPFEPGIVDAIAGGKKIGEMSPNEYVKLVNQLRQEMSEKKKSSH